MHLGDHLTLQQLELHLWEAANILRGPVDAADFKTYVFPLLFFKRISDVYDEEYAAAIAESDGDEEYARFPQNYRFQIPKNCHWNDVRVVATNVGQAVPAVIDGDLTDGEVADRIAHAGFVGVHLREIAPSLEDVFVSLTERAAAARVEAGAA